MSHHRRGRRSPLGELVVGLLLLGAALLIGLAMLDGIDKATACRNVRIDGQQRCVVAGQPCAAKDRARYRKVGLRCRQTAGGWYLKKA